jgi:hypothetical protein
MKQNRVPESTAKSWWWRAAYLQAVAKGFTWTGRYGRNGFWRAVRLFCETAGINHPPRGWKPGMILVLP